MTHYTAFLRGVNVGGNNLISMDELRQAFRSWGFANVKTVLASGNVIFDAHSISAQDIEQKMAEAFGLKTSIILRTVERLRTLADADPFEGIKVTPQTRLYVTFLAEKPKSTKAPLMKDENFTILRVSGSDVLSVLTVLPGRRTVDLMSVLEATFGKKVTTRNWNTVLRVLQAAG